MIQERVQLHNTKRLLIGSLLWVLNIVLGITLIILLLGAPKNIEPISITMDQFHSIFVIIAGIIFIGAIFLRCIRSE